MVSRHRLSLVVAAAAIVACAAPVRSAAPPHITLVAYSTPREAYAGIIAAFTRTPQGRGVTFDQSYGASGDQSRAVEAGLPADVVAFSLDPDITRLVGDGLVSPNWSKNAYHGIVTDSVVVIVVRAGNPKHITGWDDLTKPGVEVITPNPFTSGGARWNVMAAYAGQITEGRSPQQAVAFLSDLFSHVAVQDKSARDAMQTFVGGKGDAMIAYENEAIQAKRDGNPIEYIVPNDTILIENPVATVTGSQNALTAQAFVDFLYSPTAQEIFGGFGYRPVVKAIAQTFNFPRVAHLSTIADFGGWAAVQTQFFDPRTGIMAQIEAKNGISVGK
jgi:sulfate/thiosulfate transport system substrate-binding protein